MMRSIYEKFTSRTNRTAEQAWVIGRVVMVLAVLAGTWVFLRGAAAETFLYLICGFALFYNILLVVLLRSGRVRETFAIGFLLDNATLLVGWWVFTVSLAGEPGSNDMYLIVAPVLIIGVARLGWSFGVAYTVFWLAWMGGTNFYVHGPDSYGVEQLPYRVTFLGAAALIAGRLVVRLDSEKRQALNLRSESDAVAEIGRLAGSTLVLRDVFGSIATKISDLIDYSGLAVVEIDHDQGGFSVAAEAGRGLGAWGGPDDHPIIRTVISDLASTNRPVILDEFGTRMLLSAVTGDSASGTSEAARSMMLVPALANDILVAVLVAWSDCPAAFGEDEIRIMSKVGAHLSGALANARLYAHSLELNRVKEVSEAKSALLSSVSHELRTPLTSMIAFTDLLLRDKQRNLTDRQKHQLSIIRKGESQLTGLIDDLLDVSRIETGRVELEIEQLKLRALVDELVESLGPLIEDRNQQIVVDIDPAGGKIEGDRRRIQQILRNLLTNASKYSPDGSNVLVVGRKRDDGVCLQVVDSGIGIAEKDMRSLFVPFFRSTNPEAVKRPGTGLGLAIAKGFIEAHGGTISLESTVGLGTTFTVTLPKFASVGHVPATPQDSAA